MNSEIRIEQLVEKHELEKVIPIEKAIWGNATPVHQTYTTVKNGGLMLGAYDTDQLVGFSYGFSAYDGKEVYLYSHMLGITQPYQKMGLGMKLKLKQAEIAEQMGYTKMKWTFDPLQSLNAYLNLAKLGAVGMTYKENYYGEMKDELNQGMPSDRMIIEWYWNQRSSMDVQKVVDDQLLLNEVNGNPVTADIADQLLQGKEYFVTIPNNILELKKEDLQKALEWRMKTRKVFLSLFKQGFQAKHFIRDSNRPFGYFYFSK
ncbi:GNAT family N-acetyltransferase [Cerasibacillus sp. JNUCC 74]